MRTPASLFQSAPLFVPCLLFVAGIIAGDSIGAVGWWWSALALFMIVTLALYRKPLLSSLGIMLCMVTLGGVRSSTVRSQHDRVAWPDGKVRYEAVVFSEVAEKPRTMGMDIILTGTGQKLKCYVAKDGRSRSLQIGDRLQVTSHIEGNREWRQGTFDYRRYMEVHGFDGQTYVPAKGWQLLPTSWQGLSVWQQARLRFLCYRHTLLERYRRMGNDDDRYAVVAAMTLGDKSAMTRELRDTYAVAGASHVLALSGLHLGIVYIMLSLIVMGRRFRLVSQILAVAGIWAFVLLAGMPASVVRAAVMVTTYALVALAGHERMSVNALALAALYILIFSPDSLFDVGFQLSFLSMLAILFLQPLFESLVSRRWLMDRPVWRWLWGLTTVSVSAQFGVAPLVAYYFGRFSTYFILTNLVAIPAATLILWLAPVSLLLPVVGTKVLMRVVGWLNSILAFMSANLPCASIEGLHPSALQTALVYVIMVSTYCILRIYDKRI